MSALSATSPEILGAGRLPGAAVSEIVASTTDPRRLAIVLRTLELLSEPDVSSSKFVAGITGMLVTPDAPAAAPALTHTEYESPFSHRYGSKEMRALFSQQEKFSAWRQIWVALAKAQQKLGLGITDEQIAQMQAHIHLTEEEFAMAEEIEKRKKHDVMSHVETYGVTCPLAKGIIHKGATSCVVTDNADGIIMKKALELIEARLVVVINNLEEQALRYKDLACLSYTHLQAAQPTTVGKRMTLWLNDFVIGLENLRFQISHLQCLGIKGATGTQASFLELFQGDSAKVKELEKLIVEELGLGKAFTIAGQTYTRLQDVGVLSALEMIAIAAHKMSNDLRILAHDKEIEEPFGKEQIGSSAMPYKRNPEVNERICSLARGIFSHANTMRMNAALQGLERTLDDSANRRTAIPEAFLALDDLLGKVADVAKNLVVHEAMIKRHLKEELPFMAIEPILMVLCNQGADRQTMHEKLRVLAQQAGSRVKEEGKENDMLEQIANDPEISKYLLKAKDLVEKAKALFPPREFSDLSRIEVAAELVERVLKVIIDDKSIVGRAPEQVEEFLKEIAGITAH